MIPTIDDVLYALPEVGPRLAANLIRAIVRMSPCGLVREVWISAAVAYQQATASLHSYRRYDFDPSALAARAVTRAQFDAAEGRYSLAPVAPVLRVRATMLPEEP